MKVYGHLTYQERDRIALLRSAGLCPAAIAREIGRPACTVGRELKRNCNGVVGKIVIPIAARASRIFFWHRTSGSAVAMLLFQTKRVISQDFDYEAVSY